MLDFYGQTTFTSFFNLFLGLVRHPEFQETIESSDCTIEQDKHSSNYLLGWYATNRSGSTEYPNGKGLQIRKSNQASRISQVMDKCRGYESFSQSKKKKNSSLKQCQEMFFQSKFSTEALMKLNKLLSSSVQAILLAKIQFRYLQQK